MDRETIKSLIQKYKQQRESLNVVIRQLETELGEGAAGIQSQMQDQPEELGAQSNKQKPTHTADPLSGVREWQFFNKSQPDGAEQLLELVGHPLSIGVLLDGLEKGGMKIGGKTVGEKRQNLSTVLARSGRFGKAARGTWGLLNWPHITPVKKTEEVEPEPAGESKNESKATTSEAKSS